MLKNWPSCPALCSAAPTVSAHEHTLHVWGARMHLILCPSSQQSMGRSRTPHETIHPVISALCVKHKINSILAPPSQLHSTAWHGMVLTTTLTTDAALQCRMDLLAVCRPGDSPLKTEDGTQRNTPATQPAVTPPAVVCMMKQREHAKGKGGACCQPSARTQQILTKPAVHACMLQGIEYAVPW